jgi:hypothetical protein
MAYTQLQLQRWNGSTWEQFGTFSAPTKSELCLLKEERG